MLAERPGAGMNERVPETAIAEAMNRVLDAEREAAVAIAAEEHAAESVIEAARERRRRILDAARRRATALHLRAQARLDDALQQLERGRAAPDGGDEAIRSIAREALEGLARRLTSADHESR